ncbi:exocyst complex component EXO84C isoform X2 [Rhododendron vialii]|uniref:exocyst complex component EXO84C isoform X2 n=1 Tax=Rhododendron vialii TaxID=182163 RepID=UPI00265EA78A|nr:exocyst complex component EXO84C isoform X2 [Rhododendron vialii]XP_058198252.1 exocyst complex component EXO84C isoform X2 [Rhododendron vialii]XP_058198253.1 exocyst complex component EXO84C isoform X2 [Rhododendron vialii]XP_058198254.1 exocyst complex component EXO84C isoform X2 [Rhododendron vialii]
MESSEEEDDFPSIESVTPQSKIDTIYQSNTEKGIRKLCFELLDLKDAVENLCGNTRTKYLAFLRLSEEVVETEHELNDLRKLISAQGILVHDLKSGVCCELDEWNQVIGDIRETEQNQENSKLEDPLPNEAEDHKRIFLENVDVLLAEHKVEEALEALDIEETSHPELKGSGDTSSAEPSSYKSAFLKRKAMVEDQLVEITEQPLVGILELKKALSGLVKLGKSALANQLLLKSHGSRLQRNIEAFLPFCPSYLETYSATLSNLVFSAISLTSKDSSLVFGDNPTYTNRVIQWAECEIESFVRSVKENALPSETVYALRAASICVQASLSHCSALESQGLKLSKLLLVLLQPYIDEVMELNFRRARRQVLDFAETDESLPLSPRFASPLSIFATSSDNFLIGCGMRFIFIIKEIVEQLTPLVIFHFGVNILTRISHLFDKYVDSLIKALPSHSEDDNLTDLKEALPFRAETDSEQLALLGTAYTVADELLPMAVSRILSALNESKEAGTGVGDNIIATSSSTIELKDWRRHLQHSLDKLRDHFCQQYVLSFIYNRDGKTRLAAQIYLTGEGKDLFWDSDPLPSLPFQALFGKLQQLATVAGDVLVGREKIQKTLLARLTLTVVMWLSDEQEFWGVLEDQSAPLQASGLQQLILDMHFTVEIARFAGYPSRQIHQMASAIIARAIQTFSARGIDPQSALPEDEWFVETAKTAINKLLQGASGSDGSDIEEEHLMMMHDDGQMMMMMSDGGHILMNDEDISDSDDSPSSLSTLGSLESFVSAEMGELESPGYLTDPES